MSPLNKNLTKNIILLVITSLIFFAIFEIFLNISKNEVRIQNSKGEGAFIPDSQLIYKLKPNFSGFLKGKDFDTKFQTNSQGFRSQEFNTLDDDIIFMLGDSFTMGHGIEENETLANQLQKKFSGKYKIYNLGVGGYSEMQYVKQLEQLLPVYKPELIIVNFFIGNDIQENCGIINRTLDIKGLPSEIRKQTFFQKIKQVSRKSKTIVFIYEKTVLPFKEDRDLPFYIEEKETPGIINCYAITENYLREIKDLAAQQDSKLVILHIGDILQTTEKKAISYKNKYKNFDPLRINKKMHEICIKNQLRCLDLTPVFKEKSKFKTLYLGDGHWNTEGNSLASEELAKYLINNKLIP